MQNIFSFISVMAPRLHIISRVILAACFAVLMSNCSGTSGSSVNASLMKIKIDFFGEKAEFIYSAGTFAEIEGKINRLQINHFIRQLSESNTTDLIHQLKEFQKINRLNGWGYLQLIMLVAQNLWPNNDACQSAFTAFLLNQSGYDVALAYYGTFLFPLLTYNCEIQDASFISSDKKKYYFLVKQRTDRDINFYREFLEKGSKPLDLSIINSPKLGNKKTTISLPFSLDGNMYKVSLDYNPSLIEFYKTYPHVPLGVYFDATVDSVTNASISNCFSPLLSGMTETAKVRFMLHFVQTAFKYKEDNKQFGTEKVFFVEEMLSYPFSDCDDRTVLLNYLIRKFTKLKTVAVRYEEHICLAVELPEVLNGTFYELGNRKFYVCDPTYINAEPGQIMPQFAHSTAQLLDLE